jgi:hypothetical protein
MWKHKNDIDPQMPKNTFLTLCPNSNSYYAPHKHSGLTTHLILSGELTVSYPDDAQPAKETFGVGARLDVEAGRRHEVWMGPEGCTYVIGE